MNNKHEKINFITKYGYEKRIISRVFELEPCACLIKDINHGKFKFEGYLFFNKSDEKSISYEVIINNIWSKEPTGRFLEMLKYINDEINKEIGFGFVVFVFPEPSSKMKKIIQHYVDKNEIKYAINNEPDMLQIRINKKLNKNKYIRKPKWFPF